MLRASILPFILLSLALLAPAANAASQTITFNKTITENNITVTVSGTITFDTTAQTVSGTISINVVNDTSGQTIFSKTITFSNSMQATGNRFIQAVPTPFVTMAAVCSTSSCTVINNPDPAHQGRVNISDLVVVARSFGTSGPSLGDINGDGVVDISDLALEASIFGMTVFY
jgi:hypothetical protein